MNEFVKELRANIERHGLFAPGERVVVGVSGGGDSMALLVGLVRLSQLPGWPLTLHVAHLNHGIRGADADRDESLVREQADRLGLACTTECVDVPAEAARTGSTLEEAARDCRYAFFERVCLRVGSQVVAVGHHADDNAETIVQRLFRGTGLRGLAGIRPSRPLSPASMVRLVRPMLSMRRSRIDALLGAEGIPHRHDITNESHQATRNRIRHELLPRIADVVNPQAVEALMRLAEQAAGLNAYLFETAERALETLIVEQNDDSLVLDAAGLAKKRRILQTEMIRQAVLRFATGERDLNFRRLSEVADLAASASSGRSLDLPGGVCVTKSYNHLVVARREAAPAVAVGEVPLDVPGRAVVPELGLVVESAIEPVNGADCTRVRVNKPADEEWLDADAVDGPLTIRCRRPGDRFRPLGMDAEKKVAEFLLDEKVPKAERDRIAVLCDRKGPLWVIPMRIDHRARITEETQRVLRLRRSAS